MANVRISKRPCSLFSRGDDDGRWWDFRAWMQHRSGHYRACNGLSLVALGDSRDFYVGLLDASSFHAFKLKTQ